MHIGGRRFSFDFRDLDLGKYDFRKPDLRKPQAKLLAGAFVVFVVAFLPGAVRMPGSGSDEAARIETFAPTTTTVALGGADPAAPEVARSAPDLQPFGAEFSFEDTAHGERGGVVTPTTIALEGDGTAGSTESTVEGAAGDDPTSSTVAGDDTGQPGDGPADGGDADGPTTTATARTTTTAPAATAAPASPPPAASGGAPGANVRELYVDKVNGRSLVPGWHVRHQQ